ncbi:hypothetical protein [Erwinia sp. B116]|uniref:hypothetical protein n=1 Tax=Erwinia sp. B116 TaxID=1561024 RepID=UPI0011AEDD92|nr:hypothetical protein [Erwinia sp. B116]
MERNIIKSAMAFLSSSILVQLIGFASQIVLMRNLSLNDFGRYALAFEAIAMCNMIVTGAFRNYYLREIKKENTGSNLMSYQLFFGSFWCVMSTIIVGVMFSLDLVLITSMAISLVISSLIMPHWVEALAHGRRKLIIYRDIANSALTLVFIASFILFFKGNIEFLIVGIFIINASVAILFFWKKEDFRNILNLESLKSVTTPLTPFFSIFIANTAYNKIGVTYINHFSTISNVALYLAMYKFITPLFFIQASLISAVMPKYNSNEKIAFDLKFFSFFALPGLLVSVFLPLLFPIFIIIAGLERYSDVSTLLYFGSPVIFVSFIYGALSNFIAINGGQSYILKTNIYGILVYLMFLITSHIFIPSIDIMASTISFFVISESILCYIYYSKIKKTNSITVFFLVSPLLVVLYEIIMLCIFR